MRTKIAEVRLAPGQVGFYDDLTNIHLTLTKPYANVYQGMNTSGLQRSVNSKRLLLTWGSLRPTPLSISEPVSAPVSKMAAPVMPKAEQATVALEEVSVEEIAPIVEEVVPVVEEAPVEEAPKTAKKRSTKKKAETEVVEAETVKEEE